MLHDGVEERCAPGHPGNGRSNRKKIDLKQPWLPNILIAPCSIF